MFTQKHITGIAVWVKINKGIYILMYGDLKYLVDLRINIDFRKCTRKANDVNSSH